MVQREDPGYDPYDFGDPDADPWADWFDSGDSQSYSVPDEDVPSATATADVGYTGPETSPLANPLGDLSGAGDPYDPWLPAAGASPYPTSTTPSQALTYEEMLAQAYPGPTGTSSNQNYVYPNLSDMPGYSEEYAPPWAWQDDPYRVDSLPGVEDSPYEQASPLPRGFYSAPEGLYYGGPEVGWYRSSPTSTAQPGGGARRGGGGGGGGGETPEPPDPFGPFSWWGPSGVPQPLRPWADWLRQMLSQSTSAIAFPFDVDEEAESIEAEELSTGTRQPLPTGFQSTRQILDKLKENLGLTFEEEEDATTKWQKLINAVPTSDLNTQQLLFSLGYDPNKGWFSRDVGLLPNLEAV